MAITTRQNLIDYCLRRLGAPVTEINVDDGDPVEYNQSLFLIEPV